MRAIALVVFCLLISSLSRSQQQDPCAGYESSVDAPHKGPKKFNVIIVAYSLLNSEVLVTDPEGHRFGKALDGKSVLREIVRAFYEDSNTTEMDTDMPPSQKPREIVIDFVRSGTYLLTFTAQSDKPQWVRLKTFTCGKRWTKEFTIPASHPGAVSQYTLLYDSQARTEPQLLEKDSNHGPVNSRPGKQN